MESRLASAFASATTVRSHELERAGLTRTQIARLVSSGRLARVGHGLYTSATHPVSEYSDLLMVAKRAPAAVICLLSALRFHEITTQSPSEVWIAIANKAHPPRLLFPPLRAVRLSDASLRFGVETVEIEGVRVSVTNPAKTVADCFKFRRKVGLDVALEALRDVLRGRRATVDDLWRYAEANRVRSVIRPYIEAMVHTLDNV